MHTYTQQDIHIHICMHTHTYMHACTHTTTHTCMHTHTCIHAHIHTQYIHTHIHLHTHMHRKTCMHTHSLTCTHTHNLTIYQNTGKPPPGPWTYLLIKMARIENALCCTIIYLEQIQARQELWCSTSFPVPLTWTVQVRSKVKPFTLTFHPHCPTPELAPRHAMDLAWWISMTDQIMQMLWLFLWKNRLTSFLALHKTLEI